MYVVNDIELLDRLNKHKILTHLMACCSLKVSGLRLHHYSSRIRNSIEAMNKIEVVHFPMADFHAWSNGKKKFLSLTDLSSLYVAQSSQSTILALSEEDYYLSSEATKCCAKCIAFDELFLKMISDNKIIQLYNLIKAA